MTNGSGRIRLILPPKFELVSQIKGSASSGSTTRTHPFVKALNAELEKFVTEKVPGIDPIYVTLKTVEYLGSTIQPDYGSFCVIEVTVETPQFVLELDRYLIIQHYETLAYYPVTGEGIQRATPSLETLSRFPRKISRETSGSYELRFKIWEGLVSRQSKVLAGVIAHYLFDLYDDSKNLSHGCSHLLGKIAYLGFDPDNDDSGKIKIRLAREDYRPVMNAVRE